MSVINQMLQELEQRRGDGGTVAAQVRAVQHRDSPAILRWIILLAVLGLVAGGVAWWMRGGLPLSPKAPEPPAAALPAAAPPAETVDVPRLGDQRPQPEQLPQVLQLAGELGQPPAPRNSHPAAARPAGPAAGAGPAEEGTERSGNRPAPLPPVAEETASPVVISKEVRQPSAPQRAENAYRQAYAALQQGRMGEAEDHLRQSLQHDPRHAVARQTLVALYVESRQFGHAEQLLRQGLEMQPGHAGFSMKLARLQVERGDVAAALATLQHNPPAGESAEYHGFLAALLQRGEHHREAIEHYQRALRANPGSGQWLLGLGISYQADNQPARAADAFRRARASATLGAELQAFAEQRLKQLQ